MPAVSPAMSPAPVMRAVPPSGVHGGTTGLAELGPLSHHARRDLRHVGDEIVAEPYRIGRAKFAGITAAVPSDGTVKPNKQGNNRQRRPADDTQSPHVLFPNGSAGQLPRRRTLPARRPAVDGQDPERPRPIHNQLDDAGMRSVSGRRPRRSPSADGRAWWRGPSGTPRPPPR
jgi:hypothetical protein